MVQKCVNVLAGTGTPMAILHDAEGRVQWLRVLGRVIGPHDVDKSPLVQVTKAKTIDIRFAKPIRYELDGGARN